MDRTGRERPGGDDQHRGRTVVEPALETARSERDGAAEGEADERQPRERAGESSSSTATRLPSGTRVSSVTAAANARSSVRSAADHQRPLSSTPAEANVAISSRIASAAPSSGSASAAPLPSPSRSSRSSSGCRPSARARCVPRLRRAVCGDQRARQRRRERSGDEHGGRGGIAVDEHGHVAPRRAEREPASTPSSNPPTAARTPTASSGLGRFERKRAGDDVTLAREALVVEARAAAAGLLRRRRR